MHSKAALVVIFCYWAGLVLSQNADFFYPNRITTPTPVQQFFKTQSCSDGNGVCLSNCEQNDSIENEDCGLWLMCCKKDRVPSPPTRRVKTTTRKPYTRPTPTTTTEEPLGEWCSPDCGVRQSSTDFNISPIQDTKRYEFPWNVGIFTKEFNIFGIEQNVFHCGGTLIDEYVVLTAAKCMTRKNASELFVIAGMWDIENNQERRQVKNVTSIMKHPKFSVTSQINDIAMLILEDMVDFSQAVNRICLPDASVDFTGSYCLGTGWGVTPTDTVAGTIRPKMKAVQLELVHHNECESKHRLNQYEHLPFKLHESFQCAAGEDKDISLCAGDVGSPLFCTIPGRQRQFYLVGILSWTGNCGRRSVPDVFTKLTHFRKWIDNRIEAVGRKQYIYEPQAEVTNEDCDFD